MGKSDAPIEVIQDSEEEQPKSSKKKDAKNAGDASGDDAAEASEGEYEIEAILDAKHGAFPGGNMGFLVKWKGYSEEHNSWVNEADAGNAQDLIETYWDKVKKKKKAKPKLSKGRSRKSETKDASPDTDDHTSSTKRKKGTSGRKSKSSQPENDPDKEEEEEQRPVAKKAKKTSRARESSEERMDVDEQTGGGQYKPMEKFKERKSWENLVDTIDTIEKIEGTLKVFFTLNNGDKVVESSHECAKHFPQKLIQFYESNLRWRETE